MARSYFEHNVNLIAEQSIFFFINHISKWYRTTVYKHHDGHQNRPRWYIPLRYMNKCVQPVLHKNCLNYIVKGVIGLQFFFFFLVGRYSTVINIIRVGF